MENVFNSLFSCNYQHHCSWNDYHHRRSSYFPLRGTTNAVWALAIIKKWNLAYHIHAWELGTTTTRSLADLNAIVFRVPGRIGIMIKSTNCTPINSSNAAKIVTDLLLQSYVDPPRRNGVLPIRIPKPRCNHPKYRSTQHFHSSR